MEITKKDIEWFNKNKSKDEYRKIFNEYFPNYPKCRICSDVVYYYDSTFRISKKNKELQLHNKSCNSIKTLDKTYYLCVCEDCLSSEIPEYKDKNKSRVFNQLNYITKFAFNISDDVFKEWVRSNYAITEENLIKKWGSEIGKEKWENYRKKQSETNKFEYKNEKYGWTMEQFESYNKSRSITLENLIKKHGEEIGTVKWKEYCDKQKYTTTINYFVEKYGLERGTEIYDNFCKKRLFGAGYSEVSKKLFDAVKESLRENYTIYYADNEWFFSKSGSGYYLLDFFIKELNIGIEFNGDIWHANPEKYKPDDKPISFQNNFTSEDIWKKDKIKNDFLKTKLKKLIIVWEYDLQRDGIDLTVKKIIKEIYE